MAIRFSDCDCIKFDKNPLKDVDTSVLLTDTSIMAIVTGKYSYAI